MAGDSTSPATLDMWVIYDHPLDFPDEYVARRWWVTATGTLQAGLGDMMRAPNVDQLRSRFRTMGLYRVERDDADDPVVMETWL